MRMNFSSIKIQNTQVVIYRDDLNHPIVSGNKLHKLSPQIELALSANCSAVLSFGGPYSNHLHALAWACKQAGLNSIGVVRGELSDSLTPTLNDCRRWGMKLVPCERTNYRKHQTELASFKQAIFASDLPSEFEWNAPANTLVVPEGGSNMLAIESLRSAYQKIFDHEVCQKVTHVVCATGTGATMAGLYKAAPNNVKLIGIQAVAEGDATLQRIQEWLKTEVVKLKVIAGHLGRFAKAPVELLKFMNEFEAEFDIPLDQIYNGKAMLKITQMIANGEFSKDDKILFLHTGGLQGKRQHQTEKSA